MIVLIHVSIALISVVWATITWIRPSRAGLRASWSLVTLTLASGTYLVVSTHSALAPACLSGLTYTSLISLGLVHAKHRLAKVEVHTSD
ncbi:MAG TPA: hypothetical protein VLH84_05465 [Patescibacteria group bacterium]|nr:hypothetical protein [Patescibacteria group bacterium]